MSEIFASIIDTAVATTLLGATLAFVFLYRNKPRTGAVHRSLLGLAFGITSALMVRAGYELPNQAGLINGVSGPLVFAAYIGGPLSGLIAFLFAGVTRYVMGGELHPVGVAVEAGYVLAGLWMQRLAPFEKWPNPPIRTVPLAIALACTVVVVGYLVVANRTGFAYVLSGLPILGIALAAQAVSVSLVWFVVRDLARLSDARRQSATRDRQMQLLFKEAGVGAFSNNPDDAGTGSFDATPDASGFFWSDSLLEMYGIQDVPPEQRAQAYADLIHPEDRDEMLGNGVRAISGDNAMTHDFGRIYKTTGEMLYVKRVWHFNETQNGQNATLFGLNIDLTDIWNLRTQNNETAERLKLAIEGLPGLVFQAIIAPDRIVKNIYLSDKIIDIWGISPQQAYDDPNVLGDLLPNDVFQVVFQKIVESARTGTPVYVRHQVPPGWADFHGQATDLGDGTYRIEGVLIDVNAEVAAQQDAERQAKIAQSAQRMESIGKLTGGIAHDFNNLLAIIMGNLELLKDDEADIVRQRYIQAGLEATARGAALTRAMLAHARKARLAPEMLELNCVVRNSKNWMERALPAAIEIETSLLAGLWHTKLDRASLESALLNLLLNARDAMKGQGKLTIETANVRIDQSYADQRDEELQPGRYVMLAVSDTGSGIDPDTLKEIFSPFFTTKGPSGGSGMGLAMVEGFVKQSNGTVQVYTELGVGTTFKLYFPAVNAPAPCPSDDATARFDATAHDAGRILLVEDELQVRQVLATMLRSAGYDVVEAASGDDALRVFQSSAAFDLLVTDIVMPGTLQGTTLAKAIRALDPELPMIFLSGYASEATVHGNGLRPADIRLMKPVAKSDFLNAVADALGS
ncbi:ATP-binding protein [Loktanella agnita]|uniref:ATP-binding protein n=1 Tax=Loktanella agnita TaxID=287097 RepID=UPI003988F74A